MTAIPESHRGYRQGYRKLVTAVFAHALVHDDCHVRHSLNWNAGTVGVWAAVGYETIRRQGDDPPGLHVLPEYLPALHRDTWPLPRTRGPEKWAALRHAAHGNATSSKWNADFVFGYLTGLEDALEYEISNTGALVEPHVREPVAAFDRHISRQLKAVLSGTSLLKDFEWEMAPFRWQ